MKEIQSFIQIFKSKFTFCEMNYNKNVEWTDLDDDDDLSTNKNQFFAKKECDIESYQQNP